MRLASIVLFVALGACTASHEVSDLPEPCVGLDPESFDCARAWFAALGHLGCLWEPACTGAVASEDFCDVSDPAVGSWDVADADRHRLAFEEGRLRFDAAGPRCLLERIRRCETDYGDRCPSAWVPTRSHLEGDACNDPYECGEGLHCTAITRECGALHGTCRRAGLEGEVCGPDGPPCSAGLLCGEGQCVRVGARDASGTEDAPCNVATRETTGVWTYRDCGAGFTCVPADTGDRCRAVTPCDATSCGEWSTCVDGACVVSVLPMEGDACRPGHPYALCGWGTFDLMCNAERRCERSTRRLGTLCAPGWAPCVEGVCRQEPGGADVYRCMPPAEAGERCSSDGECRSHACCDHVCAG